MKTTSIVVSIALAAALGAACSSSINALSKEDAAAGDAPAGTGGTIPGTGGGHVGTGGSGGTTGIGTGGGAGSPDARVDTPLATGGSPDAGRDLGIVPATGGVGGGGVAGTDGGTGKGGSGGTGSGGATGTGGGGTGSGGATGTGGGTTTPGCGYECRTVGGVTGWYLHNELVCEAECLSCAVSCNHVGSRSEGCYSMCGGVAAAGCTTTGREGLINYMFCNDPYAAAYLAWQSPDAVERTGPAVVVSATGGWVREWDSTARFEPESPPASPMVTFELDRTQMNDLFSRLAALDVASLPHEPVAGLERCRPSLYFRLCAGCAPKTLSYPAPESVSPEMEQVWAWFDQIVTPAMYPVVHPRYFCKGGGAVPDAGSVDDGSRGDASYPMVDGSNGVAVIDPQYVWEHFEELVWGTWLIGWYGGYNHFSWIRITPASATSHSGEIAVLAEPSIPTGEPYWGCDGSASWGVTTRPQTLDLRLDPIGCAREILSFESFRPVGSPGKAFLEATISAVRMPDGGDLPSTALTGLKFPDSVCNATFTACDAGF